MACRRIELTSGVELLTAQLDQFKTSLFTVTLAVPLRKETATAYALLPEVLYRGTRTHPDIVSLSAATDDLYGAALEVGVSQRGESQCVSIQCSFIDDCYTLNQTALLEPSINLVAEILLAPLTENGIFVSEYVSSEGVNLADQIQSRINDKSAWAMHRLISEMCADEAYAIDKLGDAGEAVSITAEQLWQQYQTLLSDAKIIFYYNGSAAHERVEHTVRQAFRPLLTDRKPQLECNVVNDAKRVVHSVKETLDVTQGKLALGFRTGGVTLVHPDFPALLVCNALYGGSGTSRLFLNVREKLGLCYFISSMIDKLKGIMVVLSGVEFSDFETAQNEILEQLESIKQQKFSKQELTSAIRYVSSSLISRRDSQRLMEDDAVTSILGMDQWIDNEELIKAVEQVTTKQVSDVAQRLQLDTIFYLSGKEIQ